MGAVHSEEVRVSITVIFPPTNMTNEKYDEAIRRLDAAGAGAPSGRQYHTCFGTSGQLSVVDVWESAEQFEAFGETLLPILADVGIEASEPQISETYNIIT